MTRTDLTTLCIDVGKTSCRVAVLDGPRTVDQRTGDGLPGAAAPGAARAVAERVGSLVAQLHPDAVARAGAVGAGVAGALADPEAAQAIATALVAALRLPVAVTSDIVTAHVGALRGRPGVALVAGTGAVALGVGVGGQMRVIDGWGPDLGDLGSGSWIGREGIRAALRAGLGLTPSTTLTAALATLTGGSDPVRWVAAAPHPARAAARFAPLVLDQAVDGDGAALEIAGRAIAHLTETARGAAPATDGIPVAALGGLTAHLWFASRLTASLAACGLQPTLAAGTALDGARDIADRLDFPHERYIHRAQ